MSCHKYVLNKEDITQNDRACFFFIFLAIYKLDDNKCHEYYMIYTVGLSRTG